MQEPINALYDALCLQLKERLLSGECTAQDMEVARKFLLDNNITSIAVRGSPIANVVESFPFQDADDDNNGRHVQDNKIAK